MDFLLHDVYLPGSTHDDGLRTERAPGWQTRTKHESQPKGLGALPSTLLRYLRDRRGPDGSDASGQETPDATRHPDNEWQKQVLQLKLLQATSYTDWLAAASELDQLEGNDSWKSEDESDEYDVPLVRARMRELEDARISCDVGRMLFLLRTTLTRGLGGMGDLRLYKHSRVGTKTLIERYIETALDTLEALVDLSSPMKESRLDTRVVYEQLLQTRQAFGRSALLMSGGGTLGMNHIGVAKSLFEAQLLPRIVSGASAGSIVAAVLCTRTDDEIPQLLLDFCHGDLDVFEKDGEEESVLKKAYRFLTEGALFDISNLVRVMRDLLGDMTFQEAYNRTRRILNIGVSTASLYELPRLLNYVTAPNVMIWSAVATSCSVPFIFSPAQLLAKDPKTGMEVPWDHSPQRWIDGSVDNDLPMTRLAEMFNVNHFIVSQVNPHVVPFLEKDEELITTEAKQHSSLLSSNAAWLRSIAELAKGEALHRMHVLAELGIMPTTMSKIRSVLSQRYSGDITILPEVSYAQFPNVLKNPNTDFMVRAMLSGARATWPKLSQVRNHCAIELALDDAVQRVRTRLVFSPSQIDLRLSAFARTDALTGLGKRRQSKRRASHESSPPLPTQKLYLDVPRGSRPNSASMYDRMGAKVPGSDIDSVSSALESSMTEDMDYSSSESPPSPRSSRILFPSVSQPATPSGMSRTLMSLTTTAPAPAHGLTMTPTKSAKELSQPERTYKQLFHKSKRSDFASSPANVTDSDSQYVDDEDEDLTSGGVVSRRKRSLSTGFKGLWPPRRQ